jgi:hypothetical protein
MRETFAQVPLIINQDWEKTMRVMHNLLRYENVVIPETYPVGSGDTGSAHYDLKSLGTLSKNYKSPDWYRFAGPKINDTMHWIPKMLDAMAELKPDDGAISYLTGNGAEHIDQPKDLSAINYIFHNTDDSAYTYVKCDGEVGQYPSVVGSAWILDTTVPHGIINSGVRWNLSIHFGVDYSTLKQWFSDKTAEDLTFGM